jgi:hypothetical protein
LKWKPVVESITKQSISNSNGGSEPLYIGAASMHNGSGIHRVDCSGSGEDGGCSITTVETQVDSNDERLVYGMDWLKKGHAGANDTRCVDKMRLSSSATDSAEKDFVLGDAVAEEPRLDFEIATCSFYDNLVQIWSSGER